MCIVKGLARTSTDQSDGLLKRLAITSTVQTGICGRGWQEPQESVEEVDKNLDCADRNLWKGLARTSTDKSDGLLKRLAITSTVQTGICGRGWQEQSRLVP
jgi:thiamine monophosphate kinase